MSQYQKGPFQAVAIWAGLALIGLPLALLVSNSLPLLGLALVSWLAICVAMRALARWLGWRTALMGAALLLAGVPLAILLFTLTSNLNFPSHNYMGFHGSPTFWIVCWFLGLWSILSGLLTRNVRVMYVALHLSNWLFWLGIIGAQAWWSFPYPFLLIPLGFMLLLLGLKKPIIQKLAFLPFLPKNRQSNAVPKPADHQDYEQGYRPSDVEGGTVYTYADEQEVSTVNFPRAGIQQQP
jgi:hypothetical protein